MNQLPQTRDGDRGSSRGCTSSDASAAATALAITPLGRFGNAHYHPNDRYIMVIQGAAWRGAGTVVDPAHATRVPKGTLMIDHADKVHRDGTKDETGAYLITGIGPSGGIDVPKIVAPGMAVTRQP